MRTECTKPVQFQPRGQLARERVEAVLRGGKPDRIPFSDSYWPEFRSRYIRERRLAQDADLAEHFDHDIRVLMPVVGPWPSLAGDLGLDADGRVLRRDDFGLVTRHVPGSTGVHQQVEARIQKRSDLDRLAFEEPQSDARIESIRNALPAVCRRKCPVLKLGGPFSRTWRLRGLQQFLEDLAADPSFAAEMAARLTAHMIAVGQYAAAQLGFPRVLLHIADDFAATAGPLLSPATYERVILPSLRTMVDVFHGLGFKVSYESEGHTWPMLEMLDAAGVDVLANMEPRAGMTLDRIRSRFGDRFAFWGNVCNVRVLPSGRLGDIRAEVHRVLSAATEGGYMGLSAHSIGPDVSSDAYDYFWGLMNRYGRDPVDADGVLREC